jgi:hypothetical protein
MDFLRYFLVSLVVYLGLLVGIILSFMAKEELKPGKKYFLLTHNIVLGFILFFFLEFLDINVYLTLFLPLILVISSFYYKFKTNYIYFLLGIIFWLSFRSGRGSLLISSLIFFYGFLVSSMEFKAKKYYLILLRNLWFFVCLLLYMI